MNDTQVIRFDIERYEIKYLLPYDLIDKVKKLIAPYVEYDFFSELRSDKKYTVRSIYLDSPDLDFYYEKLDGKKMRRKLRIRTYNEKEDGCAYFLEIKRKHSDRILKERARIPREYLGQFCNERINPNGHLKNCLIEKKVIDKFLYNMEHKDLMPILLVTYDREAFFGATDERVRITLDENLRSFSYPKLDDIFREKDLVSVYPNNVVLEVKFDYSMPAWLRRIIRVLPVRQQAISKYCLGIDMTGINELIYYRNFFNRSFWNFAEAKKIIDSSQ